MEVKRLSVLHFDFSRFLAQETLFILPTERRITFSNVRFLECKLSLASEAQGTMHVQAHTEFPLGLSAAW